MEILKVDRLSLSFGGLQVLQRISFSIKDGEKGALIGPNGAGKTRAEQDELLASRDRINRFETGPARRSCASTQDEIFALVTP